jgi:hypothetical protein
MQFADDEATARNETQDDDTPPGDETPEDYEATGPRRGGGMLQFLWFVTADRAGDRVLPMADIRRMEPPGPRGREAWIHFSGFSVRLVGTGLRRVLHRIAMHRCASLYELVPGQRVAPGEPVIERMEFLEPVSPAKRSPQTEH